MIAIKLLIDSLSANNKRIEDIVVDFLINTPKALVVFIFSFFSGQLWVYIIISHFKKTSKGRDILNHFYSKIGIGLLWISIFTLPYNLLKKSTLELDFIEIIDDSVFCLLLSAVVQCIIFIIVTIKGAK